MRLAESRLITLNGVVGVTQGVQNIELLHRLDPTSQHDLDATYARQRLTRDVKSFAHLLRGMCLGGYLSFETCSVCLFSFSCFFPLGQGILRRIVVSCDTTPFSYSQSGPQYRGPPKESTALPRLRTTPLLVFFSLASVCWGCQRQNSLFLRVACSRCCVPVCVALWLCLTCLLLISIPLCFHAMRQRWIPVSVSPRLSSQTMIPRNLWIV